MPSELEQLEKQFQSIARQLNGPDAYSALHLTPRNDGSFHCEFDGKAFHYVNTERGHEYERRVTKELDEILFWLVANMTGQMASDLELETRNARPQSADFRRFLFAKHIELLESIDATWGDRQRAYYDQVLAKSPFSDTPSD